MEVVMWKDDMFNLSRTKLIGASLCLLVAVFMSGAAFAQIPLTAPPLFGGQGEGPDQSSPAATMTTFLKAMNAANAGEPEQIEVAVGCLYLAGLSEEEQEVQSSTLAQQLHEVIEALLEDPGNDLTKIPSELEEKRYEWGASELGTVVLYRYDDDLWRFNSATIFSLPRLHAGLVGQDSGVPRFGTNRDLLSPRATVRTFLRASGQGDAKGMEDALEALELPESASGTDIVFMLRQILLRYSILNLPDKPDGLPYLYKIPNSDASLIIESVGQNNEWKFTAETLEGLQELYMELGEPGKQAAPMSIRARLWIGGKFPFLLSSPLFLENWQWIGLLAIILAGGIISRIIGFALIAALNKWFKGQGVTIDKNVEKDFIRPIRISIMAWVWLLGLSTLGLPDNVFDILRVVAKSITAAGAVWALYRLVDVLGQYLGTKAARTQTKFDDLLVPLLTRSLKIFIGAFGLVFMAETLNLPLTSLLAGLGLGGLAFALAAKDTVENIFGSLTVLLDRPFQIGDWVTIGDVDGNVESVGIRSTRIRTFYNSLITVPNSKLISATVDNMGSRRYRRAKTMLSITYDTPPEKIEAFCEGIRELIRTHPYTRKDYFHVYFNAFATSSLDIMLYCFHEVPDWSTELRERHRLYLDIVRLAKSLQVEFAFPTQTLYMQKEQESQSSQSITSPENQNEAFKLGREEAGKIVEEYLGGKDAPKPPPVDFSMPNDGDDGAE